MKIFQCLRETFTSCFRGTRHTEPRRRHLDHRIAANRNKVQEELAKSLLEAKKSPQATPQELRPLTQMSVQSPKNADIQGLVSQTTEITDLDAEPQVYEVPVKAPALNDYVDLSTVKEGIPSLVGNASPMIARKQYNPLFAQANSIPANDSSNSLLAAKGSAPDIEAINPPSEILIEAPLAKRRLLSHQEKNKVLPGPLTKLIVSTDKPPAPIPRKVPFEVSRKVDLISTSAFVLQYAGTRCFHTDSTPLPKLAQYNLVMKAEIEKASAYLYDAPAWQVLPKEALEHAKTVLKERKFLFMRQIEEEIHGGMRPTQVVLVANGYNPMAVALAEKYPDIKFYVTDKSLEACQWNKEVYSKLGLTNLSVIHSDCSTNYLITDIRRYCEDMLDDNPNDPNFFHRHEPTIFALEGISYYLTQEQEQDLLEKCLDMGSTRTVVLMDYKDQATLDHCLDYKERRDNPEPYYHKLITDTIKQITGYPDIRCNSFKGIEERLAGHFEENKKRKFQMHFCNLESSERALLRKIDHEYDNERTMGLVVGGHVVKMISKPYYWDHFVPGKVENLRDPNTTPVAFAVSEKDIKRAELLKLKELENERKLAQRKH